VHVVALSSILAALGELENRNDLLVERISRRNRLRLRVGATATAVSAVLGAGTPS
jgi:hypothetical protein